MTPLEISICLHYHSSASDMAWVMESGAPIVDETMDALIRDGLLTRNTGTGCVYLPTSKLHHFVAMLEDTPLPKQVFVDPRTDGIVVSPFGM